MEPLIINQFDLGIAESAHKGFALMKRVDIESFPGASKAQKSLSSMFVSSISSTFTAVAGTDICTGATFTTTANSTGIAVRLTTTGTLPAGLATSTVYFVIQVDQNAGTFKLATNITNAEANTAIDITDTGSGTHTIHTVNPGTINHIIRETRTNYIFMQDSNGRVWWNQGSVISYLLYNSALDTGTGVLTNAAGNGIVLWKQSDSASSVFLLAFRDAVVDIIDVYTADDKKTPSWSNSWKSLNSLASSGNSHHAIVGQDDIVYFCDGRYVGSLKEVTTFAPGTASTYTYNNQALDLPSTEVAQWLEELGDRLLIGGNTTNKIYPWDRIADSFNFPIYCPEVGVKKLKNIGGVVYILAGVRGIVYSTQGSYVVTAGKIPDEIANSSGTLLANVVTWGGIAAVNGSLIFGAGVQTSGNSGLYRLFPDGRLTLEQIPTTGSVNVTAIEAKNEFYNIGYASGADSTQTTRYSALEAVVQSALYRPGTKTKPAKYSTLEVVMAKPASNGDQIRISYRGNTTSSFTTIDTFTADGTVTSFKNDAIGLIDIENIQVQAEYDGDIELVEIRLIP